MFSDMLQLVVVVDVYGVLLCVFRGHAAYGSGVQLLHNQTEVGGR